MKKAKDNKMRKTTLTNKICPHCDSIELIKAGKYKWVDAHNVDNEVQHYRCKKCNRRFGDNTNKNESFNRNIFLYEKIIKAYVNENKLISNISTELNAPITTIRRVLKNYGVVKRNKIEEIIRGITGLEYNEYLLQMKNFNDYRRIVKYISSKQPINSLPNYNKRGVCGVEGAYQLDHKYSIKEGFLNNITPLIIGGLPNLVFIPWQENNKKRSKCSIKIEEIE